MSEGKIIREDIRKQLHKLNLNSCDENVEFIFRKHMNDPFDKPYIDLILTYKNQLKS